MVDVQKAVRVSFFSVFSIGSARDGMCPVVSGSLREMSLQALLKFEGPTVYVKLFLGSPCPSFQVSALVFLGTLGHARNVSHLGALSVPSYIVENKSYGLT